MNSKFLLPLIAFLLMAVLLGFGLTQNPQELPSALIGKPIPKFSQPILKTSEAHDEQDVFTPDELLGKRWILNVWASWCPSCRYEHPLFNEIGNRTSIPLVGLNYKDAEQNAVQWLAERGNPYDRIPTDLSGDVGIDLGLYGAPETYVIDEQGRVLYRHAGPIDAELIEREIAPFFPELQALFVKQQGS